ncbi:MAG: hypothetical protein MI748_02065 [Opitutales bacterium]|nr:hypothetical protein [Opitutales bacterium]
MKKISMSLILFSPLLGTLIAGTGSATIPCFELYKNGTQTTLLQIYLSNVTNEDVTAVVTLTTGSDNNGDSEILLDGDDNKTTGMITGFGEFKSYDESPVAGGSVEIELSAFETIKLAIAKTSQASDSIFGFGKIEWFNASNQPTALIAHARWQHNHTDSTAKHAALPINNGKPF